MDGVLEVGGVDTGALCNEAVGGINPLRMVQLGKNEQWARAAGSRSKHPAL